MSCLGLYMWINFSPNFSVESDIILTTCLVTSLFNTELFAIGQNVSIVVPTVTTFKGSMEPMQLQTVDGPGQTSMSTSFQTLELVDLCWACLVSNGRLLLINGLVPILQRWVQHKPHALNMTMPPSAARAGETERWRERGREEETERERERERERTTRTCNTSDGFKIHK